jgi:colicin import membrane protein
MRTGFAASALAHVAIIALGLMSLGAAEPLMPDAIDSIAVDLVPVSEFSNIRVGSLKSEIVETETPSAVKDETPAELAQVTGNTEVDQTKPTEAEAPTPAPTLNTAPKPEPAPEPAPVPDVKPEPEPAPTPPAPEPTPPEPTPEPAAPTPELAVAPVSEAPKEVAPQPVVHTAALEQKRAQFKKDLEEAKKKAAAEEARKKEEEAKKKEEAKKAEQAKEADQVANIINNEKSRGAVTGAGGDPTLGKPTGQSATLSQSQIDALVAQIKTCLVVPAGAEEAGAQARFTFSIDQGGNVVGQPQMVQQPSSALEDAYARAALRAVMRCGPYAMAVGQDVSALFNASEF